MADLRRSVRDLFLQGVEAVNNAANHVANATRSKVDELNLRNRRKELVDTLARDLQEQWQQGLELPEVLTKTLEQIRDIDAQLAEAVSHPETAEEAVAETQEEPVEEAAPSIVVEETEAPEASEVPAKPDIGDVPSIRVEEKPEE